jgi:hypothetical protein
VTVGSSGITQACHPSFFLLHRNPTSQPTTNSTTSSITSSQQESQQDLSTGIQCCQHPSEPLFQHPRHCSDRTAAAVNAAAAALSRRRVLLLLDGYEVIQQLQEPQPACGPVHSAV